MPTVAKNVLLAGLLGSCALGRESTETSPSEEPVQPTRSASGFDITPLSKQEVERLASKLTPEQQRITQRAGTEGAFCGLFHDHEEPGTYACVVCGLPLFRSSDKFRSTSGWPSFTRAYDPQHVTERRDLSHGMVRTEINCARCGAHLGHVFPDGPAPTGLRYCLNSEAMTFEAD